jgi:hypothetical protein
MDQCRRAQPLVGPSSASASCRHLVSASPSFAIHPLHCRSSASPPPLSPPSSQTVPTHTRQDQSLRTLRLIPFNFSRLPPRFSGPSFLSLDLLEAGPLPPVNRDKDKAQECPKGERLPRKPLPSEESASAGTAFVAQVAGHRNLSSPTFSGDRNLPGPTFSNLQPSTLGTVAAHLPPWPTPPLPPCGLSRCHLCLLQLHWDGGWVFN